MSSHHVVRDEQEPALLIVEPHASKLDFIQQLLEWSPTVVVVEQALEQVLKWGIKVDVVVCKTASLDKVSAQTADQYPVDIVAVEGNHIDEGLKYLYQRKHVAVNIIADFDQDLVKQEFLDKMDVIIFNQGFKAFYVTNGSWKKWVTADTLFKVLPVATQTPAQTDNLKPLADNQDYLTPVNEGFIQINHPQHPFWIFEKLGM